MKTLRRSALLVMVLLLALAPAASATAKGKPAPPPTEPRGGYTCAESGFATPAEIAAHEFVATDTGFTFTLKGGGDDFCVDVTRDGPWTVTGTASGVTTLVLIPRDSFSPGDSCGGKTLKRPTVISETLPLFYQSATVNGCGTAFGEWIDGQLVMEQLPDQRHPLAFYAAMQGGTAATATITVVYP